MPVVSVVVPTFNMAFWLATAIASVCRQSYIDWELIVVDDGSTDNTSHVVRSFLDPRIRYVRQQNQGVATALNLGVELATGTYIAFLGADDEWLPQKLEIQVGLLDAHPDVGLCHAAAYKVHESGDVFEIRCPPFAKTTYIGQGWDELARLVMGNYICASTVVTRLSALRATGPFRHSLRSGSEDYDLWLRLVREHAVGYIAQPLAKYRVHPKSLTANYDVPTYRAAQTALLDAAFSDPVAGCFVARYKRRALSELYCRLASLACSRGQRMTAAIYLFKALTAFPVKPLVRERTRWSHVLINLIVPPLFGNRAVPALRTIRELIGGRRGAI